MRAIVDLGDGSVELNYLWLPTVIGMNAGLKREMERDLQGKLTGIRLDDEGLDKAHAIVVDYLVQKFPWVRGLADYLNAVKHVEL